HYLIIRLGVDREIQKGVPVLDNNSNVLGESTAAAKQGIALVTLSRLGMAMPGMVASSSTRSTSKQTSEQREKDSGEAKTGEYLSEAKTGIESREFPFIILVDIMLKNPPASKSEEVDSFYFDY
ncbi:unnamed protein product, partial [Timema podura]|nr:unnamed protein product [Timema podura]